MPLTSKRLDYLFCGKDQNREGCVDIIELKQWDKCEEAEAAMLYGLGSEEPIERFFIPLFRSVECASLMSSFI